MDPVPHLELRPGAGLHDVHPVTGEQRTARDPLCEVSCPYVVRGFDFDCIGLLGLNDLVWRKERWHASLDAIHESAWRRSLSRARKVGKQDECEIVRLLQRGYRILPSRAIRGVHLRFEDDRTREHAERLLAESPGPTHG